MSEITPKSTKQELHEACMAYAETIRQLNETNRQLRNKISAMDQTILEKEDLIRLYEGDIISLRKELSLFRPTILFGLYHKAQP